MILLLQNLQSWTQSAPTPNIRASSPKFPSLKHLPKSNFSVIALRKKFYFFVVFIAKYLFNVLCKKEIGKFFFCSWRRRRIIKKELERISLYIVPPPHSYAGSTPDVRISLNDPQPYRLFWSWIWSVVLFY